MPADEAVPPWTLRAAVALVSVEALIEAVVVAQRSELTTALRVFLVLCIGLKWLFAWAVLGLRAGAMFGLLLLEGTTVVAALAATDAPSGARLALGGVALAVLVLPSSSLHAFPSPTPPKG